MTPFDQHRHRIRMEWGPVGVATLGPLCSVLVIVDVLSFSTTVDIAVSRDAPVVPLHSRSDAAPAGMVVLGRRSLTTWSLSPASLVGVPAGTRLGIASLNGARLSVTAAGLGAHVLAGCLRNAPAVAAAAAALAGPDGVIGVIPGGERWPDGTLRPAVEDLIGAGAVIAALPAATLPAAEPSNAAPSNAEPPDATLSGPALSPEATLAMDAFRSARRRGLAEVLTACSSGRELVAAGFGGDVELAHQYGVSSAAPLLRDGAYTR